VLALLGLALVILLFARVGWPPIRANLAAIGAWFPALALVYALAQIAFAASWWVVLPRRGSVSFARLFGAYLAGDSVNYLAPVPVAGEPLRIHLLSDAAPTRELVASLTAHKHAALLSQCTFIALGVALALAGFPLSPGARAAALAGVFLMLVFVALMSWGLWRGSFALLVRFFSRFRWLSRLARLEEAAAQVDGLVQELYGRSHGRVVAAVALSFLGWCGGFLETWLVLELVARGASWQTAFAIEALAMALNNAFLFVPARVGASEGVRVGVFVLLGLTAAQGAAYGLVRRARELVWVVPGLVVLARRHLKISWFLGLER